MKLTWTITKKRGNWRPVLTYTCEATDWEIELCVAGGLTDIAVPASDSWDNYCLPGQQERADTPKLNKHFLLLPSTTSSSKSTTTSIRLPWRPGAHPEYPDVAQAMAALMAEWERRVLAALDSGPLDVPGEPEHSAEFKRAVAPYVAARRMLK